MVPVPLGFGWSRVPERMMKCSPFLGIATTSYDVHRAACPAFFVKGCVGHVDPRTWRVEPRTGLPLLLFRRASAEQLGTIADEGGIFGRRGDTSRSPSILMCRREAVGSYKKGPVLIKKM